MKDRGSPTPLSRWVRQLDISRRFKTLIFWLYARKDSLHPRLNARVDKMIEVRFFLPRA